MGNKSLATTEAARTAAALVDWNDPQMQLQIKEAYGKNLNEGEWKLFMGLGIATGLNPFLREIWAVKYGTNPASVFVGRDGYRRSAQAHPEYEYHYAMAVYANDAFSIKNGVVEHEFKPADRGALVGAYCIVKRKSSAKEAVTYVDLKEYVQKFGVWATKPATMIIKVAEAQGLRASFQELFAGTYEESEEWTDKKDDRRIVDATPQEREQVREDLKPLPGQTKLTEDGKMAVVDAEETAPEAPAPKRRGRPSKKTTPAVVDAQVVDEPCKHLGITPVRHADGSTSCPTCKAQLSAPTPQDPKPAPAAPAADTSWQKQPGSTFKEVFKDSPAAAAPVPSAPPIDPKTGVVDVPPGKIRTDQTKKLFAVWGEYKKVTNMPEADSITARKKLMKDMFGSDSSTSLNERQADELVERIEAMTEMAREYVAAEDTAKASGDSF